MLRIRKKYIGCKLSDGASIIELSDDLNDKMLLLIHNRYEGKYTYKVRVKKPKVKDDKNNEGSN